MSKSLLNWMVPVGLSLVLAATACGDDDDGAAVGDAAISGSSGSCAAGTAGCSPVNPPAGGSSAPIGQPDSGAPRADASTDPTAPPAGADEDGGRPPKDPMHEPPMGDDDKPKPGMKPGSVCKEQFDDCVESGMERKTCDDARRACEQTMTMAPDEMNP